MAQRDNQTKHYAILGGGPAGATLAAVLAGRGDRVTLFHTAKRPALIVGESLLPAVIPMLRQLGIEEKIKAFALPKPGATVCLERQQDRHISAKFSWARGKLPDYAYNTPRDLFDRVVLDAAVAAGANVIHIAAGLERGSEPDSVQLDAPTLVAAGLDSNERFDMIIDATGRRRLIAGLLDLPVNHGTRRDTALFAHLDKTELTDPGHIHIDLLSKGWGWRIPLNGKISVGFVIDPSHLKAYGTSPQEQYDAYLKDEPCLKQYTMGATRLTPVMRYNNYQLITQRMYGRNWVLLGDAAGFVDPVFSTGLYLGMKGAFELAKVLAKPGPHAFAKYEKNALWELGMWTRLIHSWYDGRLFNLYKLGQNYNGNFIGRQMEKHFRKRMVRVFSGEAINELARMKLIDALTVFGTLMRNPDDLVVR